MGRRHKKGRRIHGILLLDKPGGGSSNHALQRAKRLFDASKAGHTGSLDPLATGMLPICFGEATKLSAFLLDADKGYETTMKLGITTDSCDADGQVVNQRTVPANLTLEEFVRVCQGHTGNQLQVPPMVSAIKVDGQRLYKLAREGINIERKARAVTIHALEVLEFSGDVARLRVHCSKGTYIRSLVADIGEALGCGAHVTQLRRTFVTPFERHAMVTLEQLENKATPSLDALLLPIDAGLAHLPVALLDDSLVAEFCHGQKVECRQQGRELEQLLRSGKIVHDSGDRAGARPVVEPHFSLSSESANHSAGGQSVLWRIYSSTGQLLGLADRDSATDGAILMIAPRRVIQWN